MSVVSPTVTITVHAVPVPSLTITVDRTDGYLGDIFTFSGALMQNGTPVSGSTVTLYQNGIAVGTAITNGLGSYSIPWTANMEGSLSFHTEAPQPGLPSLSSPTIRVPIGLAASPLPLLAAVGIAALLLLGK